MEVFASQKTKAFEKFKSTKFSWQEQNQWLNITTRTEQEKISQIKNFYLKFNVGVDETFVPEAITKKRNSSR